MTKLTKQDVFEEALDDWWESFIYRLPHDGSFEDWSAAIGSYHARYVAALPDDMPVIPKRISRLIHTMKSVKMNLVQALNYASSIHNGYDEWALSGNNLDDLARAWLLEVWIIEETGEVVRI